jgi:hypothetical protein
LLCNSFVTYAIRRIESSVITEDTTSRSDSSISIWTSESSVDCNLLNPKGKLFANPVSKVIVLLFHCVQTYGFSKISLQLKLSISKVLAEGKSMIYFSEKEFFLTFAHTFVERYGYHFYSRL